MVSNGAWEAEDTRLLQEWSEAKQREAGIYEQKISGGSCTLEDLQEWDDLNAEAESRHQRWLDHFRTRPSR